MGSWTFLSADRDGIKVRLHKGDSYTDVLLPPTRDYFENDGQDSEYIESNFDRLWDAHSVLGPESLRARLDELEANLAVTDIEANIIKQVLIDKTVIKESDLTAKETELQTIEAVKK